MFPLKSSAQFGLLPAVTALLVTINVLVFVGELVIPAELIENFVRVYGLIPAMFISQFGTPQVMRIFSSMFIHGGIAHLLGNMWFLHIFGESVEGRLGHFSYLCLYIFCGIFAALTQIIIEPHSMLPMIGASGAIAGVLGAYLIFFPRATITTLILAGFLTRKAEIPAVFFLVFWFLMQFVSVFFVHLDSNAQDSAIAFAAHIGGFIAGMGFAVLIARGHRQEDDSAVNQCDFYVN
ncbi:MAG TPA: rhomboid family intramembrane serine protease [Chroococcales cyanobacterium]